MNASVKSTTHIMVSTDPKLELRAVGQKDLEFLRQWKNKQKQFFFHQEEISASQQIKWFVSFVKRPYDFMFMTVYEQQVFGCMGIRWQEDHWDIYNVILGQMSFGGRGLMGKAFAALLTYANTLKPALISLQVLKHNPAVGWYQKQGFEITATHETYFSMSYQSKLDKQANT